MHAICMREIGRSCMRSLLRDFQPPISPGRAFDTRQFCNFHTGFQISTLRSLMPKTPVLPKSSPGPHPYQAFVAAARTGRKTSARSSDEAQRDPVGLRRGTGDGAQKEACGKERVQDHVLLTRQDNSFHLLASKPYVSGGGQVADSSDR